MSIDSLEGARGDAVAHLLGPDGPVAKRLGAFESRHEQVRMAQAVDRALRGPTHLIVEAGTGVGKSFAYLLPALVFAQETGKKVAVATSTIALQEQLVQRDLPLLVEALDFRGTTALVKGRGNYVCLRRLALARAEGPGLFPDLEARADLEAIAGAAEMGLGTRQELPFAARDDVWDAVRAESGNCLHAKCPFYERCAYQAGRRRTHAANLLVMNHHVLLADLALRRSGASFLPDVDAIVVDEAHDLADTAAEALGTRVTSRGITHLLGRLWNERRESGLLARLPDPELRRAVVDARVAAQGFFGGLRDALGRGGAGGPVPVAGPLPADEGFAPRLLALAAALERATTSAPSSDLALELAARSRAFAALATEVESLTPGPDEDHVVWAEWEPSGHGAIVRAPVDAGPRLREALYEAHPTVILTSATLSTGRPASFHFTRERLGLTDAEELSVGSPFDYPRQARLVVRTDLPDPAKDAAGYEAALPDAVLEAVRRTAGGAFVLFTSFDSLKRTAQAIRSDLVADGLEVLVHGEDRSRTALLERFRETNAVLFGTSSFWQGVDVPGDALRNVIITRLPFDVPTHPLHRAREARLVAAGRRPFDEMSLPQAALRLKQGFGRLIRRATDKGLVVILDPRIVTKRYGKTLLDSLPECPVEVVPERTVE